MEFVKLFTPVIIAIFLIISDHKFSYLDQLKQSASTLISPIYIVVDLPSQLYNWVNEQGSEKEQLLKQNKRLNVEIRELKTKIQTYNALLLENKKLNSLLNSSYKVKNQKLTLARISSISQSRLKKQIIVNKGSNDNLKVGQIALAENGVVGQITQVTPLYSTILLTTDPTQYVPVKNSRNGVRGITKGVASNQNKLMVNFIENDTDVVVGDIFSTSAIGLKFPQGHPVGEVTHIEKHDNDHFLHIQLNPTQSTNKLEFVLIATD